MAGYEITFSITALCPCCGKELPSSHYMTEARPHEHPLDRDNPYERKDRRVFITPCPDCFVPKSEAAAPDLLEALQQIASSSRGEDGCYYTNRSNISIAAKAIAKASGSAA